MIAHPWATLLEPYKTLLCNLIRSRMQELAIWKLTRNLQMLTRLAKEERLPLPIAKHTVGAVAAHAVAACAAERDAPRPVGSAPRPLAAVPPLMPRLLSTTCRLSLTVDKFLAGWWWMQARR